MFTAANHLVVWICVVDVNRDKIESSMHRTGTVHIFFGLKYSCINVGPGDFRLLKIPPVFSLIGTCIISLQQGNILGNYFTY